MTIFQPGLRGIRMFITDFDGVLCDSIHECIISSYNAYGQVHIPDYTHIKRLEELEQSKQGQFRRLRPYIRGGEDYVLLFWTIENNIPVTNQQEFDALREEHRDILIKYKKQFYVERDFLLQQDKEQWLRLNPLFEGIEDALKQNDAYKHVHILTTKRRTDVLEILTYHGLDFPAEQITYTKASDKVPILLNLLQEHNASIRDSVFVEDQIEFLIEPKSHQIQTYLVGWSYISNAQRATAQQHEIPVIDVAEFTSILHAMLK